MLAVCKLPVILIIIFSDGVVTKQEQSANFWDCSDPYITVQVTCSLVH